MKTILLFACALTVLALSAGPGRAECLCMCLGGADEEPVCAALFEFRPTCRKNVCTPTATSIDVPKPMDCRQVERFDPFAGKNVKELDCN